LSFWSKLSDYSALPSWLTFNSATLGFSGTPPSIGKFYVILGMKVDYGGGVYHEAISTFIINSFNKAPTLAATSINSVSPVVGTKFSLQFDSSTFADPEGDGIFYFANQQSGEPLPSWAYF
jgi:hypothetical protein